MYAVECFFDPVSEDYVRSIWRGLQSAGITSSLQAIEGLRPHVTVAVYDADLPFDPFIRRFDAFAQHVPSMALKFDAVAVFPTSGTVFAHPAMTDALFHVHRRYYQEMASFQSYANPYYVPDSWNPHCTFAINLDVHALDAALQHCIGAFRPMQARLTEIAVVKLEYTEGACIRSRTICSRLLY